MRKLKLQMQITLDGFVAGPEGQGDWIWANGIRDEVLFQKIIDMADSSDTILLGRKMTPGFTSYWESVVDTKPDSVELPLARLMVDTRKIAFSRTHSELPGRNLTVENGDLVAAVQALKQEPGKDILVYGGAGFVRSLINADLIDEYYLIRCPIAIGAGMPIFEGRKLLKLESSTAYASGKGVNKYVRG